jgi:class 3 adenylate cyclase
MSCVLAYVVEAQDRVDYIFAQSLFYEHKRTAELLLRVLPQWVIDRMCKWSGDTQGESSESLFADFFPKVSILFADVVHFTELTKEFATPTDLLKLLERIFHHFDFLCEAIGGIRKIKTIGDCKSVDWIIDILWGLEMMSH